MSLIDQDLALNGGPKVREKPWPGWPMHDEREAKAVQAVLESHTWGTRGPKVQELEAKFSAFHDAEFGVAVTSGTTALEVTFRACGIGAGDEVILPPYTFIATASSIVAVNAIPVFADIDPDTYCLDPAAAEAAITPQTKAIAAVHMGGCPAEMGRLRDLARKHGLRLIEDAAQAHGAAWDGTRIGALGDAGAFSFQNSKNMSAGEGGMVLTNDREVYERAWSYHHCGRVPDGAWYDHRILGSNLRMTEWQAAILLVQLERVEEHMAIREENAAHLNERLAREVDGLVGTAESHGTTRNAYHLWMGKYDAGAFGGVSRDKFLSAMAAEGIPIGRGYNPLYREGAFRDAWDASHCPWACRLYQGSVDYARVSCPACEHVCDVGGVWIYQSALLGPREDMDDIVAAALKVREHAEQLRD